MQRSDIMRRVKGKNTAPERAARAALRALGWPGYRLNRADLPGKPDIAYIRRKRAILIHGCFWHGHDCRRGAREPKTNTEYWRAKITRNRERDARNLAALEAMGWRVLTLWECEMRNREAMEARLRDFMQSNASEA